MNIINSSFVLLNLSCSSFKIIFHSFCFRRLGSYPVNYACWNISIFSHWHVNLTVFLCSRMFMLRNIFKENMGTRWNCPVSCFLVISQSTTTISSFSFFKISYLNLTHQSDIKYYKYIVLKSDPVYVLHIEFASVNHQK